MLVDIEIPASSIVVLLHRKDGTMTVSVELEVAELALKRYFQACGGIAMPPDSLLHEPQKVF